MNSRRSRALVVLGATAAVAAGGSTFAFAQTPPTAPAAEQESAGEAPESTGPENSATDPDNVQFEQQGDNQGDNGQPEPTGATTATSHRQKTAAKHRKSSRRASAVKRSHRAR